MGCSLSVLDHIILIGFSTGFFLPKFLRWAAAFLLLLLLLLLLFFFRYANAELPPKHWTLIVIENTAFTILLC